MNSAEADNDYRKVKTALFEAIFSFYFRQESPEISDVIVSFDNESLERRPVFKQEIVQNFLAVGNYRAARIVQRIPDQSGILDPAAVDRLLITAHCELQRISEEFQHGQRVLELLQPLFHALRQSGLPLPIRLVDIGCGTGFVLRWLAARANLQDVELIGVDYHVALIEEAQRLARLERLNCSFVAADAFRLTQPASVYLSTGLLHHFRDDGLVHFFQQHNQAKICAFLHFDFQPSFLAPLGSWLFHTVRMRQSLAKHDGVLSAIRAHSRSLLLAAARAGATDFICAIYGARLWGWSIPRAFHTLIGVRPDYWDRFVKALGRRGARLEVE